MFINNYIKNTELYFKLLKKRYYFYTSHKNKISYEYRETLDTLLKDGVVIIPNFVSEEVINSILLETQNPLNEILKNNYDETEHIYNPNYGYYRILECDKVSETSKTFFNNDMINNIASAYVWKNVSSYQRMIEIRPDPGVESNSDVFHFDDWRHRFKAFLYLTDVSEQNAPFRYLRGSHRPGKWREEKDYEYYRYGYEGSYGHFSTEEINDLQSKHNFSEITCTSKKGTLILADTRGIHKGTPLDSGKRILLANYFAQRERF